MTAKIDLAANCPVFATDDAKIDITGAGPVAGAEHYVSYTAVYTGLEAGDALDSAYGAVRRRPVVASLQIVESFADPWEEYLSGMVFKMLQRLLAAIPVVTPSTVALPPLQRTGTSSQPPDVIATEDNPQAVMATLPPEAASSELTQAEIGPLFVTVSWVPEWESWMLADWRHVDGRWTVESFMPTFAPGEADLDVGFGLATSRTASTMRGQIWQSASRWRSRY